MVEEKILKTRHMSVQRPHGLQNTLGLCTHIFCGVFLQIWQHFTNCLGVLMGFAKPPDTLRSFTKLQGLLKARGFIRTHIHISVFTY